MTHTTDCWQIVAQDERDAKRTPETWDIDEALSAFLGQRFPQFHSLSGASHYRELMTRALTSWTEPQPVFWDTWS